MRWVGDGAGFSGVFDELDYRLLLDSDQRLRRDSYHLGLGFSRDSDDLASSTIVKSGTGVSVEGNVIKFVVMSTSVSTIVRGRVVVSVSGMARVVVSVAGVSGMMMSMAG